MRLLILMIALAALCAPGCAGLTGTFPTQDMFLMDGDGDYTAPILSLGPSPASLKGLDPADVKEVLMAFATGIGNWLTFAPSWTQTIGTTTETDAEASARIRAALAKEITGDTGTGDDTGGP